MTITVFKTVSDVVEENFTGKCKVGNETSIRHYFEGKLHRVDGPAVEYANGHKCWWLNGKLHRTDGPAIESYNGTQYWYVDDKELTKEKFNEMYGVKIAKFASISKIPYDFNGVCELPGSIRHYKEGLLHNENGPAILRGHKEDSENQSKEWFFVGDRHRVDAPAIEYSNGFKEWWFKGKKHRIDGPAIEYGDHKEWYENGLHHRTDGPAIEDAAGHKEWWLNGLRHRTDGPAIENLAGYKEWFIEGKEYSEEEFNKRILEMNIKVFDTILDIPTDFTGSCKIVRNNQVRHYKNGKLHSENEPAIVVGDAGYKAWYQNGKLHREDGPAIEYANGNKFYWIEDKNYSEEEFNKKISEINIPKFDYEYDVPKDFTGVCKIVLTAATIHFKNGKRHNDHGPAYEDIIGNKSWWINGLMHRVDGPASEYANGHKCWYIHGIRHCTDGPAIDGASGYKEWWIHGVPYSSAEFNEKIAIMNIESKKTSENIKEVEYESQANIYKFTGPIRVTSIPATVYLKEGIRHRQDGPAFEGNGIKTWWLDGKLHRADGPAIENEKTQRYEYWFDNVLYSKIDFLNIPDVKKLSEKNAITKKDEEMKTLKENKNFIIKCAKDAKYRVAGEQLSLAVRAAIVKILSNGEPEYMQNAEMIMSTDFGKALVQGGVSLIMHQLPTESAHVQALTYELMVASVATGEGAILTAAFSSLNDFVRGQITSIKDDTLTPARVDANEEMEEETSSESKSKLTS